MHPMAIKEKLHFESFHENFKFCNAASNSSLRFGVFEWKHRIVEQMRNDYWTVLADEKYQEAT